MARRVFEPAWQDLRTAARAIAASRGLTVAAALTLGLGVGVNTALFSLLDETLLQRLPVRAPEELRIAAVVSRSGATMTNVPAEMFTELSRGPRAFSGVLACWQTEMNLDAGADVDRVLVQYVSGRYFATLGVPMFAGRAIVEADGDAPDRPAVLSHRFWLRRFDGDPSVIGRAVRLNGLPAVVVGITPPEFFGIDRGVAPDVSIPLPGRAPFANLWVVARMAPRASDAEGRAEADAALRRALDLIRPRLTRYRESDRQEMLTLRADLHPGAAGMNAAMRSYAETFRALLLLSAGVLLIACANVANLLLAGALARTHEFGVRLALGAGRARLIQQVLAESVLLAVLGTAIGVGAAIPVRAALVGLLLADVPHQSLAFRLDWHLLAYAVLLAGLTTVAFGLMPALRASNVDITATLQNAMTRGRGRRHALARALVVAQMAAALTLLVGAVLLLRSFRSLSGVETGVALDRMLTMRIGLSSRETQRLESTRAYEDLVERARAVPGVASAALGWDFALGSGGAAKAIWVEGEPVDSRQSAGFNVVGPGFFATAGIPVVLGREFTEADTSGSRKVAVVNEAWVRRHAAGRNPIGLRFGDEGAASTGKYEVVGVVRDSRTIALRREPAPMLYQPLMQDDQASNVVLHVRAIGDPRAVAPQVREAIRALNPHLPVYDVATLDARRTHALRRDRAVAVLSSSLGAIAVLLTMIGIYGVIAYGVARRTAEIGIRMAIGATPGAVRWMVVREVLALVVVGALVGIPLALAGSTVLTSMLYGVVPQDPASIAAGVASLAGAACLAGYLPATRAARLEPGAALRRE